MEQLVDAVRAADSGWAVLAIFVLGLYLILWKFGGQIIHLLEMNHEVATETGAEAKRISESLVTNHGSASIGDAIDKITEAIDRLSKRDETLTTDVEQLRFDFEEHIIASRERSKIVLAHIDRIDQVLEGTPDDPPTA